jgi:hypothetical protein
VKTSSLLRLLALLVVLTCFGFFSQAHAAAIQFTIEPPLLGPGGSVSFAGGSAPLIGEDLRISEITGIDTPLNSGVSLTCTLCQLDFETGAYFGDLLFVSGWDPDGSSVVITGGVNIEPGLPFEIPGGSILLSGAFSSIVLDAHVDAPQADISLHLTAAMIDNVNHPVLAQFFGLDVFDTSRLLVSFTANGILPDPIESTRILGGHITSVPEPDTWLAVVVGAIWLALFRHCGFHRHEPRIR